MANTLHPTLATLWRQAATPAQWRAQADAAQTALQHLGVSMARLPLLVDPLAALRSTPLAASGRAGGKLAGLVDRLAAGANDSDKPGGDDMVDATAHHALRATAAAGLGLLAPRLGAKAGPSSAADSAGDAGAAPSATAARPLVQPLASAGAAAQQVWRQRLQRTEIGAAFTQPVLHAPSVAGPRWQEPTPSVLPQLPWPAAGPDAASALHCGLARIDLLAQALVGAPATPTPPHHGPVHAQAHALLPTAAGSAARTLHTDPAQPAFARRNVHAPSSAAGAGMALLDKRPETAASRMSGPLAGLGTTGVAGSAGMDGLGGIAGAAAFSGQASGTPRPGTHHPDDATTAMPAPAGLANIGGTGGFKGLAARTAAPGMVHASAPTATKAVAPAIVEASQPIASAFTAVALPDDALLAQLARALRLEAVRDGIDLGDVRG